MKTRATKNRKIISLTNYEADKLHDLMVSFFEVLEKSGQAKDKLEKEIILADRILEELKQIA